MTVARGVTRHLFPILLFFAVPAAAQTPADPWVDTIQQPQYFAVQVSDVGRAAQWYRSVFGLDVAGESRAADGTSHIINLRNHDLLVEIIYDARAQTVGRARGFFKVGFQVPDLDAVASRVERDTGTRPRVVDFERFGLSVLQVHDPEGNIIQMMAPSTPSRRRGTVDADTSLRLAFATLNRAYVQADTAVLQPLLTASYRHTNGGSGAVLGREEWLTWVASRRAAMGRGRLVIDTYRVGEVDVRQSGDAAVITGIVRSTGRSGDSPFTVHARFTQVWVRRDGMWRRAAFHDSAIP